MEKWSSGHIHEGDDEHSSLVVRALARRDDTRQRRGGRDDEAWSGKLTLAVASRASGDLLEHNNVGARKGSPGLVPVEAEERSNVMTDWDGIESRNKRDSCIDERSAGSDFGSCLEFFSLLFDERHEALPECATNGTVG